jgi:hypothetical protein
MTAALAYRWRDGDAALVRSVEADEGALTEGGAFTPTRTKRTTAMAT